MCSARTVATVVWASVLNDSVVVVIPTTAFANPIRQYTKTITLIAGHQSKFVLREGKQGMNRHAMQPAFRIVQFTPTFVAISVER